MQKLVEREDAPPARGIRNAPALAIQFFLIPLAVVAVLVLIYAGFRMIVADERTAEDYLNDIRMGGRERQWPAAYELSRLMADPAVASDPTLAPALLRAFQESSGEDPRIRRYLALALGRLDTPAPGTVDALMAAARGADSEVAISAIWALGSLGDRAAVPPLQELYGSSDAGVRKVAVYALGALPAAGQIRTLETALNDPAADVQWNAAVALSRHGNSAGLPILHRMLDRAYVERTVTRAPLGDADADPAGDVIISGLQAVASLEDGTARSAIEALGRDDPSLRVRQAALEALEALDA